MIVVHLISCCDISFVSCYLTQFEVTTNLSHSRSEEWNYIPDDQKEEMGLTFDHDGEFWYAYFKIWNISHLNFKILIYCFEFTIEIKWEKNIR